MVDIPDPRLPASLPEIALWLDDVIHDRWAWVWNSKCKYVNLRIDTRRGVMTLTDRDGNDITLDELKYQYPHGRKKSP